MKGARDIHIFLGDDTVRSRDALLRAVEKTKARDPHTLILRFDDVTFDPTLAWEALGNTSLFGGTNTIIFDGVLSHERGEEFYQTLPEWPETPHTVYIREVKPPKDILVLFKKYGEINEFPLRQKIEERTNNFAIADAIAARNKKAAWVEFARLYRRKAVMEELHGMIFWAVKSLYICKSATKEEAEKAGVKSFIYRKYQQGATRFLASELEEKLTELKDMYHRAHAGEGDLGIFLERFILKI